VRFDSIYLMPGTRGRRFPFVILRSLMVIVGFGRQFAPHIPNGDDLHVVLPAIAFLGLAHKLQAR